MSKILYKEARKENKLLTGRFYAGDVKVVWCKTDAETYRYTLNKTEFSEKDKTLTLPSRFRTGWAYKCVPVYAVPFLGEAHLTFETLKTFVNECV